jgi:hypothetical protein
MPSGDEAERIQRDIARTMGDVIRHDMRNVHRRVSPIPDTAEPRAAPKGNGWRDPAPLSLPPGQDLIERMVNAALPARTRTQAQARRRTAKGSVMARRWHR